MIIIQAHLDMKPGRENELLEAARRMAEASREEPGCITYAFFTGVCEPSRLLLLQEWRDLESLQHHQRSRHMQVFVALLEQLVVGEVVTKRYSVEDGAVPAPVAARDEPQVH